MAKSEIVIEHRRHTVADIARKYDWVKLDWQENIYLVSYVKDINGYRARINVYLGNNTVSTSINHPKKGKTQMFRKNVSFKMLDKIFNNPRQHTGKGYRFKKDEP